MSKVKKAFFCQKCGTQHAQWQGQCNGCKAWNTLVEEVIEKPITKGWTAPKETTQVRNRPIPVGEITTDKETRLRCPDHELDRVLGVVLSRVLSLYWAVNLALGNQLFYCKSHCN